MARQVKPYMEGTFNGMVYYKVGKDYFVRTAPKVRKNRVRSDPSYARIRELNETFGYTARSGKLLRETISDMLQHAKDNTICPRLVSLLSKVRNLDSNSNPGERTISGGIATEEGRMLLKDFNFNKAAPLRSTLYTHYTLTKNTLSFDQLVPARHLFYPSNATHCRLSLGIAKVDFENGKGIMTPSESVTLPLDGAATSFELKARKPRASGCTFYLLLIEFFQEFHGAQYPVREGAANVLSILEAEGCT